MNYALLCACVFGGLFGGVILTWSILCYALRSKDKANAESIARANRPNELLSERNQIGEREARALSGINATLAMIQEDAFTRRERIAVEAMAAIIAKSPFRSAEDEASDSDAIGRTCRGATAYADMMIAELDDEASRSVGLLSDLEVIRTVATEPHHPNALKAIREIAERGINIAKGKEIEQ